ncbi:MULTISPECIES: hypothetical protein [Streptomyces]|uniref:hypothetical protein n=1 Tax=Streptomyces TaxID=1883 RepID=UPI003376DAFE
MFAGAVADADPRLPDLSDEGVGAGLAMVRELAGDHDRELVDQPAPAYGGKIVLVLVRFRVLT